MDASKNITNDKIKAKQKSSKTAKSQSDNEQVKTDEQVKSTLTAREAGADDGRKRRAEYFAFKKFVIEREEENFSKLMIVHEKDEWWKIFGHSAIMFAYEVSGWIDMKVKLRPDSDYDYKSKEGVVIIRDVYTLDAKLAKAKVNLLKSTDDYRVYNLGKKFSEADLDRMMHKESLEWGKVNKIITVRDVFPDLHTALRELFSYYYFSIRKLETFGRDAFGMPIADKLSDLLAEYDQCCNEGTLAESDYLAKVEETMKWTKYRVDALAELKAFSVQRIYRLLRLADRVQRLAEQCRQRKI